MKKKRDSGQYAIYRGDRFLTCGTIDEIAKELKLSPWTVRCFGTPSYTKTARPYDKQYFLINLHYIKKREKRHADNR